MIKIVILNYKKKRLLFVLLVIILIKESKEIKGLKYKEVHWIKLLYIMDRVESLKFPDYLFIRRVAAAFANCASLG